jgi:hypothetical protein
MGAFDGEFPLAAEVTLGAGLRLRRDDRQEQRALADLPPDLGVPRVAAPQLVLVEPHFVPGGAQRLGDAAGGGGVFAGVAEED